MLPRLLFNANAVRYTTRSLQRFCKLSTSASVGDVDLNNTIIITKSCANRIKKLRLQKSNDQLKLRVQVDSGGCSGFQYVFRMEDTAPVESEDNVFERDGAHVVVDTASLQFIKGATLDFEQELIRSAFAIVNNPQSESACGCGSSFAVKNFEKFKATD